MQSNSWLWIALYAKHYKNILEFPNTNPFFGLDPRRVHEPTSRIIAEKLANTLPGIEIACPDCGEDVVGQMLHEDIGDILDELVSGERINYDAFSPDPAVKT